MTCSSNKEIDQLLKRRINKTINRMAKIWMNNLDSWFTEEEASNYFNQFDRRKGAMGFLPDNLEKYLKDVRKVPSVKIQQCIERIDQLVKGNRYIKYKTKRDNDKKIRKLRAIKENRENSRISEEEEGTRNNANKTTCLSKRIAGFTIKITVRQ